MKIKLKRLKNGLFLNSSFNIFEVKQDLENQSRSFVKLKMARVGPEPTTSRVIFTPTNYLGL